MRDAARENSVYAETYSTNGIVSTAGGSSSKTDFVAATTSNEAVVTETLPQTVISGLASTRKTVAVRARGAAVIVLSGVSPKVLRRTCVARSFTLTASTTGVLIVSSEPKPDARLVANFAPDTDATARITVGQTAFTRARATHPPPELPASVLSPTDAIRHAAYAQTPVAGTTLKGSPTATTPAFTRRSIYAERARAKGRRVTAKAAAF